MSADREAAFRRLLAWFPHTWREQWEEVALGSLLDDADHRQLTAPGRLEAWSIRGHGLVERLASAVRPLAVAGLAVAAVGAMVAFLVQQIPAVGWLSPLCSGLLCPLLIAAVAAGHGYRAGLMTVRGTLLSLTVGLAALTCSYLAGRAWAVGFDEADAGQPQSWFAAAFVPFALAGLALGTTALLPQAIGVVRAVPSRIRMLVAVVIAGGTAATVGAGGGVARPFPSSSPIRVRGFGVRCSRRRT